MGGEFSVRDGHIVDRHGRVRIFHGINVSGRARFPPFLPLEDVEDLDVLARWGWNLVRLVAQWEAIEPEPRRYDDVYLDTLIRIARACEARGLHVIVDLHQDLFARHYGGDGAPPWALPKDPGGPRFTGRAWFANYFFCGDLIRAQQRFWRDAGGLQALYCDMLSHLARRFADVPGLLGYDLMNEPMGPPVSVLLGTFERKTLAAFYRKAIAAVRKADPERLVFIEPEPLAALGHPCFLPRFEEPGVVFAPHLYDPVAILTRGFRGPISTAPFAMGRMAAKAARLGAPVLIGEFGVVYGHAGGRAMVASQVERFDERFFSWAAWHYNPDTMSWGDDVESVVTPEGKEREFLEPLIRPYARAVAGRPYALDWDARARRFNFEYVPDPACAAPTEIVIPFRCFGAGAAIVVEGARWKPETVHREILFIEPRTDAPTVRVTVAG